MFFDKVLRFANLINNTVYCHDLLSGVWQSFIIVCLLTLLRYFLFRTKWFSIYIHRFLLSDDEVPHDHPFSFWTYVVDGGYIEKRWEMIRVLNIAPRNSEMFEVTSETKWLGRELVDVNRKPGSWAFRNKESVHRVVLHENYTLEEKEKAPLTICFIGPMKPGTWGFYPDGEFVVAKDFLDANHSYANNIPEKWRDG